MSLDLKCPQCETSVPDTGMSSSTGIGGAGGDISFQPARQHTTCPNCDARLVRNPDSDVTDLRQWRLREPEAE
jgi:endogenous inhibitor of DNA gyrase (YacG/DUF329 family)